MPNDLRSFLALLEKRGRGELVRISRPVDRRFEVAIIQEKLAAAGQFPVLYFEHVHSSELPLVTNLWGSYDLLGLALDVSEASSKAAYLQQYLRRTETMRPVKEIPAADAPVKQVVLKGGDVDLSTLPITTHAENDSGPYIVAAGMVTRDPDTGIINVGMYRHEVRENRAVLCAMAPMHHGELNYHRHRELNKPMEAALFLGHHPAVGIGLLTRGPMDLNEYEVIGALLGEPLEVVKGETVDLPVPARAEIVIEGTINFDKETLDGPFAEFTGYYGQRAPAAWLDVNCITMRRDAIYHDLDPAHREHNLAIVLCFEAQVFRHAKNVVPSVKAVHMPFSGRCLYHIYVQLAKRIQGEGKLAGLAALSAEPMAKHVFVVDEDVDIYNEEEVWWAIATRLQADTGISIINNCAGSTLDPSRYGENRSERGTQVSKMVFDATKPATLPFSERIAPPPDVWQRIKLEDYIQGWAPPR